MERVYLLTRETPLMSKVTKKSKKQPSTTTRTLKKNLLPEIMDLAQWCEGYVLHPKRRKVMTDSGTTFFTQHVLLGVRFAS
jgi:hypothetical protein